MSRTSGAALHGQSPATLVVILTSQGNHPRDMARRPIDAAGVGWIDSHGGRSMKTRIWLYGGPADGDVSEVPDSEYGVNGVFIMVNGKVHLYRTISERRFLDGSAIRVAVFNETLLAEAQEEINREGADHE